jgi:hypothetical protein
MGLLKKHVENAGVPGDRYGLAAQHPELTDYPFLVEFLTSTVWDEDRSPRVTGTVLIFADAGGLKAMLNDRDGSRVSFVLLDDQQGILEALENVFATVGAKWTASAKPRVGKKP